MKSAGGGNITGFFMLISERYKCKCMEITPDVSAKGFTTICFIVYYKEVL
jgi:hypothetical protein